MKKFLVIVSLLIFLPLTYTAPPVEIVNTKPIQVEVTASPQPSGIEIFNIAVSSTSVSLLVNKNWDYSYFYISNTTNSTLLISTSTAFTTSFRISKGMIFSSDVIATLYGKIVDGGEGGIVDVMIEKK